jgi:hypothetical protein
MILSDLLSELRENILHDRSDQIAGVTDRLWSDSTLIRYIDDAQQQFARRALCLRDSTTAEVVEVTLVTGQSDYVLHDTVLYVLSVRHEADEQDLSRIDHMTIGQPNRPPGGLYDPAQLRLLPDGKPIAFTTDAEISEDDGGYRSAVNLRLYPAPTAEWNGLKLKMRVVRLPLNRLTEAYLSAQPEIPEMHHIEMLDWAAYLALRIADHELGNPNRAHEFRKMFETNTMQARREALRKMFAPVGWGFGRNGFVWES